MLAFKPKQNKERKKKDDIPTSRRKIMRKFRYVKKKFSTNKGMRLLRNFKQSYSLQVQMGCLNVLKYRKYLLKMVIKLK